MKLNLNFLPTHAWLVLLAGFTVVDSQAARYVDCSSCHGRINSEWRTSAHAGSYTLPLFLHQLEKSEASASTRSSCSCHAPDFFVPEGIGNAPGKRPDSVALGVDCISCHMDRELVAFANSEERTVPHWVRSDERYSQGVFCAGCHAWAENTAVDCQDCHMPEEIGPVTDHPMFARPADAGHRSHRMPGLNDLEFVAGAVSLEVIAAGRQLRISLANLIPVHGFPQIDRRRAVLTVAEEGVGEALWSEDVRLAADSTAGYTVELPRGRKPLTVELRLYPAAELWPDSSVLVVTEIVNRK